MFVIRKAHPGDTDKIYTLYKKVAEQTTGIARSGDEVSEDYVERFVRCAAETGIQLVIDNPQNKNEIIAEIHCYKLQPGVFSHVLSELTIVVDPHFQGKGLGKIIFSRLLEIITQSRADILRVELIARESNIKAIAFYRKIGFKEEGRFEKRIRSTNNGFEADIPMAWFNSSYKGITQ